MSRKSRIGVIILTVALVVLSLCAVPTARADTFPGSRTLRFTVVKRTAHYDIVRGHSHRFPVRHNTRRVILHGIERYQVVRRTHNYVFLRETSHHGTPTPTLTSANSGGFSLGTSTTITWRMSTAVSSGYFGVSLRSTLNGASVELTPKKILAVQGARRYSVAWSVSQAVGSYTLCVLYSRHNGKVISADVSDGILSISPTPIPPVTPTPASTATPTPTPSQPSQPAGAFNVMDYGAHADSANFDAWATAHPEDPTSNPYDDTAHIQAAVDACYAAGGGTVYIPAGTYSMRNGHIFGGSESTGCVELRSGVTIQGAGSGSTVIKDTKANSSAFVAHDAERIGVSDLAGYTTVTTGSSGLIKFYKCSNAVVDSLIAHDWDGAIDLIGCSDCLVSNMLAYDIDTLGFCAMESPLELTQSDNVVFSDCEAFNCGVAAFRVTGTRPEWPYPSPLNNFSLIRCNGHDSNTGFYISHASNGTLVDCIGADSVCGDMLIAGVHTLTLTRCTAAHVVTATNGDDAIYAFYGDSSDTVEN